MSDADPTREAMLRIVELMAHDARTCTIPDAYVGSPSALKHWIIGHMAGAFGRAYEKVLFDGTPAQ